MTDKPQIPPGVEACAWDEALEGNAGRLGMFGPVGRKALGFWEGPIGEDKNVPLYEPWLRPATSPDAVDVEKLADALIVEINEGMPGHGEWVQCVRLALHASRIDSAPALTPPLNCERCHGTGELRLELPLEVDGKLVSKLDPCPECNGTGLIAAQSGDADDPPR